MRDKEFQKLHDREILFAKHLKTPSFNEITQGKSAQILKRSTDPRYR
jgi:hypothetical protein